MDVDELKQINEAQGRAAGDEILRATARIILGSHRGLDHGFQIGGDEFGIVLVDSGPDEAVGIARRILASAFSGGSGTLGVAPFSLTIGVSALPGLARDRKQLSHQADAALYWGKRHGRTDIQVFDPTRHGIADDGRSLPELAAAVARVAANQLRHPCTSRSTACGRDASSGTRAWCARARMPGLPMRAPCSSPPSRRTTPSSSTSPAWTPS